MARRCHHCVGLSIESLIRLAKDEFKGYHEFPKQAFYQHHNSLQDLEASAESGCELCTLILDCFKGAQVEDADDRPMAWPEDWVSDNHELGTSMFTVAKGLDDSSIRIAISADHVYATAGIEDVSQFDTLLVQIGPRDDGPEAVMDWVLPPLPLAITVARGDVFKIDEYQIGHFELVADLAAMENFEIARGWLKTCRTEHAHCPSDDPPVLPTRVIDVGTAPDFQDLRIFLSAGTKDHYVALSHCWGGSITPLLTTKTLEYFTSSLPYTELPANFQHAITITREMKVRYLWIDSLCIIQDSKRDWERESVKMAKVYRDSMFTISALASSGSKCGILANSPRSARSPKPVTLTMTTSDSKSHEVKISLVNAKGEYLNELANRCPLSSRGWCLQEAVLSPRHLYYGQEQIYWRCPSGFHDAEGCGPGRRFPSDAYDGIASALYGEILRDTRPRLAPSEMTQHEDVNGVLTEYYLLVQDYSHRELTFSSDKLPAFSGVAQRLHTAVGGAYLAGLWSTDICRALSWRAEGRTAKHVRPARTPSWSWAVTDEWVWFDVGSEPPEDGDASLNLQLLEHEIKLHDKDNAYGQVESGSLTVRGLTTTMARSSQLVNAWPCSFSIGTVHLDNEDIDEELGPGVDGRMAMWSLFRKMGETGLISIVTTAGHEDDWEIEQEAIHPEDYLVLLVYAELEGEGEWTERASCLLLQQDDREGGNTYRRVGVARLDALKVAWLRSWEETTLRLI
ncbi:HET-domain-containing protein [Cryphonectria parasitica EP155]|uniref:HET-domain-containing protein n=1 Tax=Cryphonectria parasitica (strain ATCC 38755 / EP155) TaxID=660469 RepID=A0A9P5CUV6_CRYP1|nr:HET-domain-containing protein [Cryphonectria parasitica EP155]KAF3770676.1 HET-domain-containing protein [Cryphonectria parasitica EP155]